MGKAKGISTRMSLDDICAKALELTGNQLELTEDTEISLAEHIMVAFNVDRNGPSLELIRRILRERVSANCRKTAGIIDPVKSNEEIMAEVYAVLSQLGHCNPSGA